MSNQRTWEGVVEWAQQEILDLRSKLEEAKSALRLISSGKRADGTYNRSREACEKLAQDTLKRISPDQP